jgi:hypothetical protein
MATWLSPEHPARTAVPQSFVESLNYEDELPDEASIIGPNFYRETMEIHERRKHLSGLSHFQDGELLPPLAIWRFIQRVR